MSEIEQEAAAASFATSFGDSAPLSPKDVRRRGRKREVGAVDKDGNPLVDPNRKPFEPKFKIVLG